MLTDAAYEGGWAFYEQRPATTHRIDRTIFHRGDETVVARRDRFRHTTGRAYRDNRLVAIFRTQAGIARFLIDAKEH